MVDARITARNLSKVFARYSASRNRVGISTAGPAAMKHLLIQMFRRSAPAVEAARRGPRYLRALSDLSFDVAAGEVIGIIGRNGAGKSTLLKVLARVLHPTSGRVVVRGRIVSMLELGVGFAPSLTVRQNIHIQGRLAGISGRRIVEAEDAILEESGLRSYADGPLRACPGGSGVQLAFAAMVGFGADVILADEVLAVGDSAFRRTCEDRVRAAASAGASVLFVSHDMAAIRRICSRVIWIDRGRLVRSGPPDEVVEAYTSELLAGRLRPASGGDGLEAGCALLDLRLLDATGGQVGALQLSEPGYIDCVFRINPGIAAVVEMTLYHRKNVVFSRQSAPFTSVVTSTFRAGLLIPADFLNEQQYQVRVRLLARRLVDIEDVSVAEERLEFSVLNPHPERSVWHDWPGARRGLISPRLSWSVQSAAPGVEARVAE